MRKLALVLAIMIFFASSSFAACGYSNFCPPHAYDLSPTFGRTISNNSGATSLSEKIAQIRIRNDLKKATGQNFNVTIKSYSLLDLLHGRFKFITISGQNLNINGAYLSALEMKTVCDFNYVNFGRNTIKFKENMVLGFSTVISDADLMKTMKSSGYLDKLNCVNIRGCGITFFKLDGADVKIKKNKLYFTVKVTSQLLLAKPLNIVLATNLKAENGRIVMTKVNMENLPSNIDLSNVANRLDEMNPLAFSLNVLENKNTKLCIQKVSIVGDKIYIGGNIFIPKNVTQSKNAKG